MKKSILFAFCIGLSIISYSKKGKNDIEQIKILKIPFNVEFPMSIDCTDFEKTITGYNVNTYIIKELSKTQMIMKNIKNSTVIASNGISTKAKLLVCYKSGKIDTLCFSSTSAFYFKGQYRLLKNRELISWLDKLPYDRNGR